MKNISMPVPPPGARHPWPAHLAAMAPLALFIVFCYLRYGGEAEAAEYFRLCRDAFPGLRSVVSFLTSYGNIPFYLGYAVLLVLSVRRRDFRIVRFVVLYLVLLVLLLLATDVLKIWIGRPRPLVPGGFVSPAPDGAHRSFPSSHVVETLFTVTPLLLYCRNRFLTLAGGVWLATMAFTRVFLGRHHPSDFLGSMVLGGVWVWLLWRIAMRSGVRDGEEEQGKTTQPAPR